MHSGAKDTDISRVGGDQNRVKSRMNIGVTNTPIRVTFAVNYIDTNAKRFLHLFTPTVTCAVNHLTVYSLLMNATYGV